MKITIKREQRQMDLSLSSVSNLRGAKTRLLSALAISALLFSSCSNDDTDTSEVNDGRVKFSSGVSGMQTKVGGADGDWWSADDPIGIYMVKKGTTTVVEEVSNVKYQAKNAARTTEFYPLTFTIYYPVNTPAKVGFIAYHPHSATVNNYEYQVNTAEQTNQSAIDLMRSEADNGGVGYDKTQTGAVNLVFDHQLTKLIIKTTPDAGLTTPDLANMTVSITGLKTKAMYTISTDVLGAPSDVVPIALKTITAGKVYEAIVVPQAFNDGEVTVEFALNNAKKEVFVFKVPATTFSEAKKHEFSIKVARIPVLVNGTINAWQSVGASTSGTAN